MRGRALKPVRRAVSWGRGWPRRHPNAAFVLPWTFFLAVVAVGFGILLLWFVPNWLADATTSKNDVRRTFVPVFGGAVVFAAGALTAYFAFRRISIAEQGQITERYTR